MESARFADTAGRAGDHDRALGHAVMIIRMATVRTDPQPSPEIVFETLNAYQRTGALQAAIQLDLFTAIADGHKTSPDIAGHIGASEKGTRVLCDYLTI